MHGKAPAECRPSNLMTFDYLTPVVRCGAAAVCVCLVFFFFFFNENQLTLYAIE